ncbi:MAG: peptide deformylase [Bacillota bacterium]
MALLQIKLEGESCLRRKSEQIKKITKQLLKLGQDMLETMYEAKGVGLAGPQVGINKRIIVVDTGEGPFILINPEIMQMEGRQKDVEGCLSIPGRNEYITRAASVIVSGLDLKGRTVKINAGGLLARAFQHEIDHLNGILFIDYLSEKTED